jgi:hypothetical protein
MDTDGPRADYRNLFFIRYVLYFCSPEEVRGSYEHENNDGFFIFGHDCDCLRSNRQTGQCFTWSERKNTSGRCPIQQCGF